MIFCDHTDEECISLTGPFLVSQYRRKIVVVSLSALSGIALWHQGSDMLPGLGSVFIDQL